MGFLFLFVSTFLTNYFLLWILSLLKIRNKQTFGLIIISIFNLGSAVYDLYLAINYFLAEIPKSGLYYLGDFLAIFVAYITTVMILLDGKKIFKTRRQRTFMSEINNTNKEVPTIIFSIIFTILGVIALVYGIITTINYERKLLFAIIGSFLAAIFFIGLAIYVFFNNHTKSKKSTPKKGNALLLLIEISNEKIIFETNLIEPMEYYLGDLNKVYIFTEYGNLITPNQVYIVKGLKLTERERYILNDLKLSKTSNEKLYEATNYFARYTTKIITVDENYNVIKEVTK